MKQVDIKALSTEDVRTKLEATQTELRKMRFAHAVSPISKPTVIRDLRRTVARLHTELATRS